MVLIAVKWMAIPDPAHSPCYPAFCTVARNNGCGFSVGQCEAGITRNLYTSLAAGQTPHVPAGAFCECQSPASLYKAKLLLSGSPPPHLGKCPPSAGLLTTAPGNPQTLAPGSFHFSKHYEHIYCILVFRNSGKWLSIKACTFLASYLWKNKWGGDGLDGNSKTT